MYGQSVRTPEPGVVDDPPIVHGTGAGSGGGPADCLTGTKELRSCQATGTKLRADGVDSDDKPKGWPPHAVALDLMVADAQEIRRPS